MSLPKDIDDREYQKFVEVGTGQVAVRTLATGFGILNYDYIELGYTGGSLTSVIYKIGGSGGTTVGTLTLNYTSGNLTSVVKT